MDNLGKLREMHNDSKKEPIGFNKPFMTGNELQYIMDAVKSGKISGDGEFTKKCHLFFENRYKFKKTLLTTSCTDALELSALLLNLGPGDEIIAPSFTFVSTVNAFLLRGVKIVFVDSTSENPNMDPSLLEELINENTKAIIPVHYAGIACEMDTIMALAKKYGLYVIEDAAQAIDSYYKGKPLGGIGQMGAFSFHETKNVISGEGGMLVLNDLEFADRAEVIREKGTNRSAFFRGEVDKYGWVDVGSSFLPSDLIAAFLFAQLENINAIQQRRLEIWNSYNEKLSKLEKAGKIKLPVIPEYASNNGHMFYLTCENLDERTRLVEKLKKENINAVFHYISLHSSKFYAEKHDGRILKWSDYYTDSLVRLPFFYELKDESIDRIVQAITSFYED